jgi:hypothetical protein
VGVAYDVDQGQIEGCDEGPQHDSYWVREAFEEWYVRFTINVCQAPLTNHPTDLISVLLKTPKDRLPSQQAIDEIIQVVRYEILYSSIIH